MALYKYCSLPGGGSRRCRLCESGLDCRFLGHSCYQTAHESFFADENPTHRAKICYTNCGDVFLRPQKESCPGVDDWLLLWKRDRRAGRWIRRPGHNTLAIPLVGPKFVLSLAKYHQNHLLGRRNDEAKCQPYKGK